jgi:hypothetical protein
VRHLVKVKKVLLLWKKERVKLSECAGGVFSMRSTASVRLRTKAENVPSLPAAGTS